MKSPCHWHREGSGARQHFRNFGPGSDDRNQVPLRQSVPFHIKFYGFHWVLESGFPTRARFHFSRSGIRRGSYVAGFGFRLSLRHVPSGIALRYHICDAL